MSSTIQILASLLIASSAACASTPADDATSWVTGTIGGTEFTASSAALLVEPDLDPNFAEVRIGEGDVCATLAAGETPNTGYIDLYVPRAHVPGTVGADHSFSPDMAGIDVNRLDAACDQTTDDYANTGTATFDNADLSALRGTIDGTTKHGDHVTGDFVVSCTLTRGRACNP